MQNHAFFGLIDAVDRADGDARCVGAVHAGDRERAFAGLAVVQRHHAAAVDAPGHFVFVLARGDAGIALDAALGITEKLHPGHDFPPQARSIRHKVTLVSCICVTES